jgi:hypothetical protein
MRYSRPPPHILRMYWRPSQEHPGLVYEGDINTRCKQQMPGSNMFHINMTQSTTSLLQVKNNPIYEGLFQKLSIECEGGMLDGRICNTPHPRTYYISRPPTPRMLHECNHPTHPRTPPPYPGHRIVQTPESTLKTKRVCRPPPYNIISGTA